MNCDYIVYEAEHGSMWTYKKTRVSLRSPEELAREPWLERKVNADYK